MMAKIYGHALPLQLGEAVEDLESIELEPEAPIELKPALPVDGAAPPLSDTDFEISTPKVTATPAQASGTRLSRVAGASSRRR